MDRNLVQTYPLAPRLSRNCYPIVLTLRRQPPNQPAALSLLHRPPDPSAASLLSPQSSNQSATPVLPHQSPYPSLDHLRPLDGSQYPSWARH